MEKEIDLAGPWIASDPWEDLQASGEGELRPVEVRSDQLGTAIDLAQVEAKVANDEMNVGTVLAEIHTGSLAGMDMEVMAVVAVAEIVVVEDKRAGQEILAQLVNFVQQ
jgi:hypothetical protein